MSHWLKPTEKALDALLALPANWDSYGARVIDPARARSLMGLLRKVMRDDTPTPQITPFCYGGVLAEWHINGIDMAIEALADSQFDVWYDDENIGKDIYEFVGTDWTRIRTFVAALTAGKPFELCDVVMRP